MIFCYEVINLHLSSHIVEALAGIQSYIDIFAKKIRGSREVYQKIVLGSSCENALLLALGLYQNFLHIALKSGGSHSSILRN